MNINYYSQGYQIEGYTQATTNTEDGSKNHPPHTPNNWAYVHFEELNASRMVVENYYPAKILGFIIINGITEVIIHCSEKPSNWTEVKEKFIAKIIIGTTFDVSYVTVPVLALVHPHYVSFQIMDPMAIHLLLSCQSTIRVGSLVTKLCKCS